MEQLLQRLRDNSLVYGEIPAHDKSHVQEELRSFILSDYYFSTIVEEAEPRTRLLELIADLYSAELSERKPVEKVEPQKISDNDIKFIDRLTQLAAS